MKKPMMKTALSVLLCAVLSAPVFAGDIAAGKAKSAACAACHGVDGNSAVATFPRLAGQHESYLLQALKSYKKGTRKNDVMKGMVAPLSERDMEDLAAYFAAQKGLVVKH